MNLFLTMIFFNWAGEKPPARISWREKHLYGQLRQLYILAQILDFQ